MNFEIAPKSTESQLTWDEARMYCFSLKVDGKVGWRLPTKQELDEIYQSENDFEKHWYWSSTENNGGYAWFLSFSGGNQYNAGKSNGRLYVRAIRDLS
jgi:hypothetical protein